MLSTWRHQQNRAGPPRQPNQDPLTKLQGLGALFALVVDRVSQAASSMIARRIKKLR